MQQLSDQSDRTVEGEGRPELKASRMFITGVKIRGFKSYHHEAILENLGPGLNVIIGRNGSGKSNILNAIDIALSDTFSHLKDKERGQLVNSGLRNTEQAQLEITLDNSENLVPYNAETIFVREFSRSGPAGKYSVDGQRLRVSEHPLLSFHAINTLYRISQGDVARCVFESNEYRLSLLKDVTGFTGWETWTKPAGDELAKYKELIVELDKELSNIEHEFKDFQQDSDSLRRKQERDKMIECINFYLTKREFLKHKRRIEQSGPLCRELREKISECQEELKLLKTGIVEIESDLLGITRELKNFKSVKRRTASEVESNVCRMEGLLHELDTIDSFVAILDESGMNTELKRLEENIDQNSSELEQLTSQQLLAYEEFVRSFSKANYFAEVLRRQSADFDMAAYQRQRQTELTSKNKEEKRLMRRKNAAIKQVTEIKDNILALKEQLNTNKSKSEENKSDEDTLRRELLGLFAEHSDQLRALQKCWECKASKQREIQDINDALSAVEISIQKQAKAGANSYKHVPLIVQSFANSSNADEKLAAANYFGTLLENISEVSDELRTAVEVSAGRKMFFNVVKDRVTAIRIMNEYNRRRYPGEVNFLVEDSLKIATVPEDYVRSQPVEVVRLLPKIAYSSCAKNSMNFAFGQYLLCKDTKNVKLVPRIKATFVSIDGDTLKCSGPMTGGYHDPRKSVLRDQQRKRELLLEKSTFLAEMEKVVAAEARSLKFRDQSSRRIQRRELKLLQIEQDRVIRKAELEKLLYEITCAENNLPKASMALNNLLREEAKLKWEMRRITDDIARGFPQPLPNAFNILEERRRKCRDRKAKYDKLFQQCQDLEKKLLDSRTSRRKLIASLGDANTSSPRTRPTTSRDREIIESAIEKERKTKQELQERFDEMHKKETVVKKREVALSTELDEFKQQKEEASAKLKEYQSELTKATYDPFGANASKLAEKIKMLSLGNEELTEETARPDCPQYMYMTTPELLAELARVTEEQRQNPVTLCSLDENDLVARMENKTDQMGCAQKALERAQEAFEDIIEAGPIASMWVMQNIRILLPEFYREILEGSSNGCNHVQNSARFTLYGRISEFNASNSDGEMSWANENLTGARLELVDKNGKKHDIQTLSGGQRSVLSLAFILAIQKSCPSRFFLFDEIDQALDERHRLGVLKLMKRLCSDYGDQFFCTSFNLDFVKAADRIFLVSHAVGNTSLVQEIDVDYAATLPFLGEGDFYTTDDGTTSPDTSSQQAEDETSTEIPPNSAQQDDNMEED